MLNPAEFAQRLTTARIRFYAGVPDSLLKDICAYIADHADRSRHIIAANEGAAIALAAGHYLATGEPGLVYLQNSGLGNTVNPLTSLVDPEVYSIPVLLLVGWRGEPGVHDEPQHVKQGRVTIPMLESLELAHEVLPADADGAAAAIERARRHMEEKRAPYVLIVRKGTFSPYSLQGKARTAYVMSREEAIVTTLDTLGADHVVVSTTGMTSREVYEHRARTEAGHGRDFLTVGCMGHASQIALGLALARPDRRVVCLDGDGAVLMHMGSLAIIGERQPANLLHVLINNGAHDSVGAQPTVAFTTDLPAVALACGYRSALRVESRADLSSAMLSLLDVEGPSFLEVRVYTGARADLGRPKTSPVDNKAEFMRTLGVPT
jgi:phosphonopyruvate decarboxylase